MEECVKLSNALSEGDNLVLFSDKCYRRDLNYAIIAACLVSSSAFQFKEFLVKESSLEHMWCSSESVDAHYLLCKVTKRVREGCGFIISYSKPSADDISHCKSKRKDK